MSRAVPRPDPITEATALVVGVGGIGGPCAWALADAGVGRLVLVDPDVVETSNLPRQVLFAAEDCGQPKAEVAARRLARAGLALEAVVGRFDDGTAETLLARADVVVDATDGAAAKDLVQRWTVAAGVPFVHAAALGSEGRVLDVPAGGRPCLACLFGSGAADAEGDTCARHGVFPGLTGAVGALAAAAALDRLRRPRGASRGLRVLDLAVPRAVTLAVETDPRCLVCGPGRAAMSRGPAGGPAATPSGALACAPAEVLDLREESCPMNLLRARRAMDRAGPAETLEIWLGAEGAATVPGGLRSLGHHVVSSEGVGPGLRIRVRRRPGAAAGSAAMGSDAWLRRYARQIVLSEVGEGGQRALQAACVRLRGAGTSLAAAAVHLAAAGVGTLEIESAAVPLTASEAVRWPYVRAHEGRLASEALADSLSRHTEATVRATPASATGATTLRAEIAGVEPALELTIDGGEGALAQAQGALVADATMRAILAGRAPSLGVRVHPDGTVASA